MFEVIFTVAVIGIIMAAGAYLEAKFGAKAYARIKALEEKVAAFEAKIEALKK